MTSLGRWPLSATLLLYAAVAAAVAPPTAAMVTSGSGDGTYYWSTVHGACALSPRPPQYAGRVGVAIATGSYGGDAASLCGACLAVTTTGGGSGANPLPPTFDAYVMDECPTCGGAGDLDVARPGDGRWPLSWRVVDCPVLPGGPRLYLVGSHAWYVKAQVRNVARPVAWVRIGGVAARRTHDHFWVGERSWGSGFGDRVDVKVGLSGGGEVDMGKIRIRNGVAMGASRGAGGGGRRGGYTPATPRPKPPKARPVGKGRGSGGGGGRGGSGDGRGGGGGGGGKRSGGCAGLWGQCGGEEYSGSTCCVAGAVCRRHHRWYSQCAPAKRSGGGSCAGLWGQCGGEGYYGSTCCVAGAVCRRHHRWYSQCAPAKRSGGGGCAGLWGQCGGEGHSGPSCCAAGSVCRRFHKWYSQCRPSQ